MDNLTAIDLKVLNFLKLNGAHFSEREIARRLRLNQSTVNYSINKMEKMKVINSYVYRLNPERIGLNGYAWFFFNFRNDLRSNDDIFKIVMQYPEVHVATVVSGMYDIALKIYSKDVAATNKFVMKLEKECKDFLELTYVLYTTDIHKSYNLPFPQSDLNYNLDFADYKILEFKMQNPNATLTDVAKKLEMHRNTVNKRWANLWQKNILLKKTPVIKPELNNLIGVDFRVITLLDIDKEKKEKLVSELMKLDELHELSSVLTQHDLFGIFRTKDVNDFYSLLGKLYSNMACGKAIKSTNSHIILKSTSQHPKLFLSKLKTLGVFS